MGVMTALAAVAATAAVAGGIQGHREGEKQADRAEAQAAARAAETKRVTERQTTLEQRDIAKTLDRQKLAFLASGVTLEGSPLLVMEETRRRGAENIEEIQKAGAAGSAAQLEEGRAVAEAAKTSGRQALIRGIAGGAGSLSRLAQ